MNKKLSSFFKNSSLITFTTILFIIAACKKSDMPIKPDSDGHRTDTTETVIPETINTPINKWITENMRYWYYWNTGIPADQFLNFTQSPPKFFETILSKNPKDRFSWIENVDKLNNDLAGVSTSTGIDFNLWLYNCDDSGKNCKNVFGSVRYVIPGSPAEIAGVKRGMIFYAVDDKYLTLENYESVLIDPYYGGKGFKINLGLIQYDYQQPPKIVPTNQSIELGAIRISEPSVHFTKILTTNSGVKVGYIFYNRFLNDKSEELFTAFNQLKADGVKELVLDLRYNLGGGIAVSGVLAALIKQNYSKEDIFVKYKYNSILNKEIDQDPNGASRDKSFKMLFPGTGKIADNLTDEEYNIAATAIAEQVNNKVEAANLNLSRVYILATGNSASASELVIHNLAPYINVVHIGETTVGKNEGSITIEDTRKPRQIDWAIQPIIVKLADKNEVGDYESGLKPDYEVNEDVNLPLTPLGTIEDPLLAKALTLIDPTMAKNTLARMRIAPAQQSSFTGVTQYNKKITPLPVLIDGTINRKELFRK